MSNIETIVEYFGAQEDRHCGYCKRDDPSRFTHGMWAHKMTVEVYQDILDRGWRRSGTYCYKPTMEKTCCPQYTIRCDALQFHASRSQKRVVRKMNAFLAKGIMPKRSAFDVDIDPIKAKKTEKALSNAEADIGTSGSVTNIEQSNKKLATVGQANIEKPDAAASVSHQSKDEERRKRKKKYLRRQRKLEKLRAKGISIDSFPPKQPPAPKSMEAILGFDPSSTVDCIKVNGASHRLEIRLVRSCPASQEFNGTFQQSVALYLRYQDVIHNDPSTQGGYRRFLVDSPLITTGLDDDQSHQQGHVVYGSFHQQYWLDGNKLIAVGVVDILPHSISSKYFYYDPDFRPLALGVYSALQEIAFVRRLQVEMAELRYYYMGYYIHTCPKMRYKGRYRPSELMCPESYTWHPIEDCHKKLDAVAYSRFDEAGAGDENGNVEAKDVIVLYERTMMPYPIYKAIKYKRSTETDEEEVAEFGRLLGKKAVSHVMLCRD